MVSGGGIGAEAAQALGLLRGAALSFVCPPVSQLHERRRVAEVGRLRVQIRAAVGMWGVLGTDGGRGSL